jgi:SAM-dependent methyltransferase
METASRSPVEAYEALAPVYDPFVAQSDYEALARGLDPHLAAHGPRPRTVLDLACGTGNSFLPFRRRGYSIAGCDLSPAMLSLARAKAPEARLFTADIRYLPTVGRFGLVTCLDDALNYLLCETDLLAAFRAFERNLADPGLGIFDVNTLCAYRTIFAQTSTSRREGVEFVWRGHASPDSAPGCEVSATLEAHLDGGPHQGIRTTHRQRHFPNELVERLLRGAGLELAGRYGLADSGALEPRVSESSHSKAIYLVKRRERR